MTPAVDSANYPKSPGSLKSKARSQADPDSSNKSDDGLTVKRIDDLLLESENNDGDDVVVVESDY